jgi:hypothetical protein
MLNATNTSDNSRNKAFTYNLLNLPLTSSYTSCINTGTVIYTYDGTGNKLRKVSTVNGITQHTDYINGIQYDDTPTGPELVSFVQTEEAGPYPTGQPTIMNII